jgi:hypothetical protein
VLLGFLRWTGFDGDWVTWDGSLLLLVVELFYSASMFLNRISERPHAVLGLLTAVGAA